MKIGVLGGAGAMGGIFGGRLAAAGEDVSLIDVSREAVDAINANGLKLENKGGKTQSISVKATTDVASIGEVELLINFVKCYHTKAAIEAARPIISDNTVVLTLQNGWGNVDTISNLVGGEHVLVGLTYHSGTLLGAGHVKHAGVGVTHLGELDGSDSERLNRITRTFDAAGLETAKSGDIVSEIWKKLALNACTLPTSALLGYFAHQLVKSETVESEMAEILAETVAVASASGITLDYDERWEAITSLLTKAIGGKASMLQDVQAKRRTEIDVINGAIVAAGAKANVPTPHNVAMVNLVKGIEKSFAPDWD